MESGPMARVGTVPLRAALLHYLCHEEEGAAMLQTKTPHPATMAGDMAPVQSSVWILLGSMNEDILRLAEDIYCGQYQLALSILTCQHYDLLMQDLHDELDWWLIRAGLHSTTQIAQWCGQSAMCSGWSQSRGRACFHAPPWAHSLSQS